jgi:hypothetical protein
MRLLPTLPRVANLLNQTPLLFRSIWNPTAPISQVVVEIDDLYLGISSSSGLIEVAPG